MSYPERIVPDETEPGIVAIHLKRYEFAREACGGKRVLDAACGVGYGSAYLAEVAASVLGVDRDEDAIAYARRRYGDPGVEFRTMDVLDLELEDDSVDVVCSFETLEHVPEPARLLTEVARVLRPEGTLFVSTPRVNETTTAPDNPHHELELSPEDFQRLLEDRFGEVELYGQRRLQTARHRLAQRADVLGLRKRLGFIRRGSRLLGTPAMTETTSNDIVISPEALGQATELVAVCRAPRK